MGMWPRRATRPWSPEPGAITSSVSGSRTSVSSSKLWNLPSPVLRACAPVSDALGHLVWRRDGVHPAVVAAAETRVERVLLAPDDTFGHPRGAAGVDDVPVIAGTLDVDPFGRRRSQRVGVLASRRGIGGQR